MQQFKATTDGPILYAVIAGMQYKSVNKGRKAIKHGYVKAGGKVIVVPTFEVKMGTIIEVHSEPQMFFTNVRSVPFEILYEDANMLAFEKPAGWLTASPDPRKRSAFSLMKMWMFGRDPKLKEVHFVNKLPKDASGIIVIAKNSFTRSKLQENWNKYPKRYYMVAEGTLPEDGIFGKQNKDVEEGFSIPYRRMNQGVKYVLVRFEMLKEAFSELLSYMEMMEMKVPGYARRGKADRSMGRLGLHFFAIDIMDLEGKDIKLKTAVPREFLNLVKKNLIKS